MKILVRNDDKKFSNGYHVINVIPIAGVDFNYKESMSSDYTVIITGLVDPFGYIYVVDMFRKRVNIEDFPKYFFSYYRKWGWEDVGIDANANQIVMKPFLEVYYNLQYSSLFPDDDSEDTIGDPAITPLENHGQKKLTVIESVLTAEWNNIRFYERMPDFEALKKELKDIRNSPNDDIGDAMANMVRVKTVPRIIDVRRIDPSTGSIAKTTPGITDLIYGMNEFDRIMAT